MSDTDLEQLQAALGALQTALDSGDLDAAGEVIAAYDTDLRRYVAQRGSAAPVAALRELLQTQNDLLACMQEQQDTVAGELRRMRKADAASRAYATAGARQ